MRIAFKCFVVNLVFALTHAADITITPNKPSGVYEIGEKIQWKVEGAKDVGKLTYYFKKGGLTIMKGGTHDPAGQFVPPGPATLETSLDEPGTILLEVNAKVNGKDVKALAGAVVAPSQIKPSAPKPDDFDSFWKEKVDKLNAIPPNPQIENGDSGKPNVEYAKVTLDNINETHVHGQLARPKSDNKDAKFPALLIVQYAGIYPLKKTDVVKRAEGGWLALNIMAHDLPIDKPEAFYKELSAGKLKDYLTVGDESRETSYFLRMYLGCYRSADYLASRPDWDGKTLVVTGTSQGGQQTLITAGLHPKITAALANVPAGCDTTGPQVGRASGFPYWSAHAKWRDKPDAEKAILETSRYFDATNFATRITCPTLIALGLIDETCPPAGVLSAANQIKGPKEVLIMVNSNHHGTNNAQKQFWERSEAWLRDLAAGKPAPVK